MSDPMAFESFRLASGLQVFHQYRDLPWCGAALVVGVGHRNDPVGKEGAAHLLEHRLSAGTAGAFRLISRTETERWIEEREFAFNRGTTGLDYTAYGCAAPTPGMPEALGFLRDFVLHPAFAGDFEHDREIVRAERIDRTTPRSRRINLAEDRAVFGGHRLATATGLPEDDVLDGLAPEDVADLHRRYYYPANMRLVVVGGMPLGALSESLGRIFGAGDPDRREPAPRPEPVIFGPPSPGEERFPKEGGAASKLKIQYSWYAPPLPQETMALIREAAREALFERLRETMKLTYHVGAAAEHYFDHSVFSVRVETAVEKADQARRAMELVMRDPAALKEQLVRTKKNFISHMRFADFKVEETIRHAEQDAVYLGRPQTLADLARIYGEADVDAAAAFFAERFRPETAYLRLIEY